MSDGDEVKRIPQRQLTSNSPIPREPDRRYKGWVRPAIVRERLGIRRYNDVALEIASGRHALQHMNVSGIGFFFVIGLMGSAIYLLQGTHPFLLEDFYSVISLPLMLAGFVGLWYLLTRKYHGSYIRLNRQTRKVYYIFPGGESVTLDWDELKPLAAHMDIGSLRHSIHYYPLLLLGVDWTRSPPLELFITCGNNGFKGSGEPAFKLWHYMQHFINYGPEGLPPSPPLLPKISRKQSFLDGYIEWAEKFRKDLSTPKGKRWAVLWVPAKVLWLIWVVFPMSVEAYLDHTVPEMQFSEEMDVLCEFKSSSDESPHH